MDITCAATEIATDIVHEDNGIYAKADIYLKIGRSTQHVGTIRSSGLYDIDPESAESYLDEVSVDEHEELRLILRQLFPNQTF